MNPDAEPPPDVGPRPVDCGGLTGILCPDGAACMFSGDCDVGSICNTTDDPYFDPTAPVGVCTRVVCSRDTDCTRGQVCTVARRCRAPVCQLDAECSAGEMCSAGACVPLPLPTAATRCEVLTRDQTVRPGTAVGLDARVFDANGRVIAGVPLTWRSSAVDRVRITVNLGVGGAQAGVAEVSAQIAATGRPCANVARIENVIAGPGAGVRVRVRAADTGAPLVGARVFVDLGGAQREASTDGAGLADIPGVMGDVASLTVVAADREILTVLSPGGRDLVVSLDRRPDPSLSGGFRGVIDLSNARRGDLSMGFAGAALPSDLSGFRLSALLGEAIETRVDAPELGLNNQLTTIPGGVAMQLGNLALTIDDVRCQGATPQASELGCIVARAPAGPSVGWTFADRFRLQDVASIAGRLSGSITDGDSQLEPLFALLPLFGEARHGVVAQLDTTEHPRVAMDTGAPSARCADPSTPDGDSGCRSDFARYAPVRLELGATQNVDTVVTVPPLPRSGGGRFARGALVFVAANLGRLGLVPLGVAIGEDAPQGTASAPDGRVAGSQHPFGPFSAQLADGEVGLRSAAPHSGLEGRIRRLVAVAFDEVTTVSDGGTRLSGIVMSVAQLGPRTDLAGRTFLPYARGVLDRANGSFRGDAPPGTTMMRVSLRRGPDVWRIVAPGTMPSFALPDVAVARAAILGGGVAPDMELHAVVSSVGYAELFAPGAAPLGDVTDGFSSHRCGREVTAECHVE